MTDAADVGRPAATLVIVRDRQDGPPELLMVERASSMAFAAGALVFPGGAVDDADHALAAQIDHGLPPDEAAHRIAAIRETIEEAGLGIGLTGAVDAAAVLRLRDALQDGRTMGDMLARLGLGMALDTLTPFARWHPAGFENVRRIFDTRFYIARAPVGQMASVDTTENVRLFWSSAADTLASAAAGAAQLLFPTRRTLERLALHGSHDAMVDDAHAYPVEKIRPWQEEREGAVHLCIPDHLGYPVTAEPMGQVRRV